MANALKHYTGLTMHSARLSTTDDFIAEAVSHNSDAGEAGAARPSEGASILSHVTSADGIESNG